MSWTNDVVLEFLEHYRAEEIIWDPKHPLHRNRNEVNDAWSRIQNNLSIHCSIVDLKRKKESLMTSFRRHINTKKKSSSDYHVSWFAFSLMESFLGGKYECDSSIKLDHEYESNNTYQTTSYSGRQTGTNHDTNGDRHLRKRNHRHSGSKAQANSDYNLFAKNEMEDVNDYIKNVSENRKDIDEYELYCQLLAKKLRKLDERQRDIAMHEIDNIMFNAKMKSTSTARSISSSPTPTNRKVNPLFIIQPQQFDDENIQYQEHQQS